MTSLLLRIAWRYHYIKIKLRIKYHLVDYIYFFPLFRPLRYLIGKMFWSNHPYPKNAFDWWFYNNVSRHYGLWIMKND